MKKEYFAPDMELLEIEIPYLLTESVADGGSVSGGGEGDEGDFGE